jgi:uncharacterized protein (TIGR02246 family)
MTVQRRNIVVAALAAGALMGVSIGAAPAEAQRTSARCTPISAKQVEALFDRWNATLATGNPDAVVRNYATDAVLLPTAENGPMIGREAIRGYFVHFLERHPQGAIDQRTIRIGCNTVFDAGTYTFTLDGKDPGSRVQLPARYTYIYEPRGGQWLIAHHHSSAMPVPPR